MCIIVGWSNVFPLCRFTRYISAIHVIGEGRVENEFRNRLRTRCASGGATLNSSVETSFLNSGITEFELRKWVEIWVETSWDNCECPYCFKPWSTCLFYVYFVPYCFYPSLCRLTRLFRGAHAARALMACNILLARLERQKQIARCNL